MVNMLVVAGLGALVVPSASAAVVSSNPPVLAKHAQNEAAAVVLNGYKLFNLSLSMYDPVIVPMSGEAYQYDGDGNLGFSEVGAGAKVILFGTSVHWYGTASSRTMISWGIDKNKNLWSLTGPPTNDDWGLSSSAVFDHDATVSNPVNPSLTTTPRGQFGYFEASWYIENVTAGYTGSATISNITLETGLKTEAESFADTPARTLDVVDASGATNEFFSVVGDPEFQEALGSTADNKAPATPFPHLKLRNKNQINFAVPDKTSFMVIKGAVSPNGASYEISITPDVQPKDWSPNSDTVPGSWSLNSSCPLYHEATMFYMPLDPEQQYHVSVKPNGSDNRTLAIQSVTFYSSTLNPKTLTGSPSVDDQSSVWTAPAATSTKSSTNIGVIAGAIVAGVAVLLLAGGLGWFLICRRCGRRAETTEVSHEKAAPRSHLTRRTTSHLTRLPSAPSQSRPPPAIKVTEEWRNSRLSISADEHRNSSSSYGDSVREEPFVFLTPPPDRTASRNQGSAAYRPPPVSLRPFWDPRLRLDRTRSATSSITEMHSIASSEAGDHGDQVYLDGMNSESYSSTLPFFDSNDRPLNSDGSMTAPLSTSSSVPTLHRTPNSSSSLYWHNRDNSNRDTAESSADWTYGLHLAEMPADTAELGDLEDDTAETSSIAKVPFSKWKSQSAFSPDQQQPPRMPTHLNLPSYTPPPHSPPPAFAQERDAGLLIQVPMELIPPSYDPVWAESRENSPQQ